MWTAFLWVLCLFQLHAAKNTTDVCTGSCWVCVSEVGCVWCNSQQKCTQQADCFFTGYRDCCYTLGSCDQCVKHSGCVFCISDSIQSCQSATGPLNDCSTKLTSCPTTQFVTDTFVLAFCTGFFLEIGSAFLILSLVLFFIYLWRWHKKYEAEAEYKKLYHEKRAITQTIVEFENKYTQTADTYTTLAPLINKMRAVDNSG